jgi:hypothetical protein
MQRWHVVGVFAALVFGTSSPTIAALVDGPPVQMVSGNNQSVTASGPSPGTAVFAPLVAIAVSPKGETMANAAIEFTCTAPANAQCLIGTTPGHAEVLTSGSGRASAVVTVVGGYGPVTVRASRGRTVVTFSLNVGQLPSYALSIVAGGTQTVPFANTLPDFGMQGTAFAPLQVKVTNNGNPAVNVPVSFACPTNGGAPGVSQCSLGHPGNPQQVTVNTDSTGVATLNGWYGKSVTLFGNTGTDIITASYANQSVKFTLTGSSPPIATTGGKLVIVSGNNQTVALVPSAYPGGSATLAPVTVQLVNANNQAVPGATVCVNLQYLMNIQWSAPGCAGTDQSGKVTYSGGYALFFWDGTGSFSLQFSAQGNTGVNMPVTVTPLKH